MSDQAFRKPLTPGESRVVSGSTGLPVAPATTTTRSNANMARLEGTGKDPLGRFGKGEIFDVPKYTTTPDGVVDSDGELTVNTEYQELIDKGWAKEVKPEDDPGRTVTQIADTLVTQDGSLAHPVDAAIADSIAGNEYAIVHSGDPNATADGDLKTDAIREAQVTDKRQWSAATELGEEPVAAQREESSSSSSRAKSSGGPSSS